MLEVLELSLILNSKKILDSISLSFDRGINLIAGPNGSGKTTLLRILVGLLKPSSGRILLDGLDITLKRAHERVKLGIIMAPERMKLPLSLTVDENLRFCDRDKAYEYFPELKKISGKKAKDLSGGERQMVILARAFAASSKYLLLDEPFQGLHEKIKERVLELLEEEKRKKGILVVTHDELEKVFSISDSIYILVNGKILYAGEKKGGEKILRKFFI